MKNIELGKGAPHNMGVTPPLRDICNREKKSRRVARGAGTGIREILICRRNMVPLTEGI